MLPTIISLRVKYSKKNKTVNSDQMLGEQVLNYLSFKLELEQPQSWQHCWKMYPVECKGGENAFVSGRLTFQ